MHGRQEHVFLRQTWDLQLHFEHICTYRLIASDIQGEFIFSTFFGRLHASKRLHCGFTAMRRSATSSSCFAVQSVAWQHYREDPKGHFLPKIWGLFPFYCFLGHFYFFPSLWYRGEVPQFSGYTCLKQIPNSKCKNNVN